MKTLRLCTFAHIFAQELLLQPWFQPHPPPNQTLWMTVVIAERVVRFSAQRNVMHLCVFVCVCHVSRQCVVWIVLIIDLTAAEASCWVCVYSYFKLKLRCILCVCVCVWLFVPLPPSIGPQQGGGWFTGLVDGWVGGGRWSWWSHHSGICAAEVKPHTR